MNTFAHRASPPNPGAFDLRRTADHARSEASPEPIGAVRTSIPAPIVPSIVRAAGPGGLAVADLGAVVKRKIEHRTSPAPGELVRLNPVILLK